MGTTAQKLEYLGTTKSQLKDMINYGLDDNSKITSSTTFRNYVSSIFNAFLEALRTPDTLFTNLPKKSGTGANITLNDTANAPMRITLGASELTQDGTPSPTTPQDIHTISGSNTIKAEGKNLYNGNDTTYYSACTYISGVNTNQYKVKATGTDIIINSQISTGSSYSSTAGTLIPLKYGETLYYDTGNTNFSKNIITQYNANKVSLGYSALNTGSSSGSYTPSNNDCEYVTIRIGYGSATSGTEYTLAPIFSNSPITGYTPYVSQEQEVDLGEYECGSIGNYENIPIRTSGKNLFDKENYEQGYCYISQAKSSNANWGIYYLPCKANETYTISGLKAYSGTDIMQLNDSKTIVSRLFYRNSQTSATLTATQDGYIGISFVWNSSASLGSELYTLMINKGSTALPYKPYGNGTWYLKQEIGKVVLDGSENWGVHGSIASWFYADNLIDGIIDNSVTYSMYSNYYIHENYNNVANLTNGQFAYTPTGNKRLVFKNTSCSTANDFKTLLSTHNIDLYYILATPTYTPITGTLAEQLENVYQKMLSQEGQTNISQVNNDLPFELDVTALENIS